jgi:hypothetical protein
MQKANVGLSASVANSVAAGPAAPIALSTRLGLYCILGSVSNVLVPNGEVGDTVSVVPNGEVGTC